MSILAWHFVGDTLRDGRPIPKDGEWLVHEGEVKMCESGLHASIFLLDAMKYAPGLTLCRVELDGEIICGDDKAVASKRKILQRKDVSCEIRRSLADQALSMAHLWDRGMPDIVREYLTTLDESKRIKAENVLCTEAYNRAATYNNCSASICCAYNACVPTCLLIYVCKHFIGNEYLKKFVSEINKAFSIGEN